MGINFALAFYHNTHRHRLHPPRRKCRCATCFYFFPQHGREFVTHQTVENPTGLLGIYQVQINASWAFNGFLEGFFGNFSKNNAFGVVFQTQGFFQVPRNGFAFAVVVRGEPNFIGGFGQFFEFVDYLHLVGGNFVGGLKTVGYVDTKVFFGQIADVAEARFYGKITTQIPFDGFGFGGRLNYY